MKLLAQCPAHCKHNSLVIMLIIVIAEVVTIVTVLSRRKCISEKRKTMN